MFTLANSMDYSICMKKRSSLYNMIFGLGILFIVAGLFLTLQLSNRISVTSGNVGMVIFWLLLGSFLIFREITHNRNAICLFIGFYSLIIGIITMLAGSGTEFLSIDQLWPVLVIGFGLCALIAMSISNVKMYAFLTVPSLIIIVLGLLFSLFSFDIITEPFVQFAARWWPILLIICGSILVGAFSRRQHFASQTEFFFEDDEDHVDYDDYISF